MTSRFALAAFIKMLLLGMPSSSLGAVDIQSTDFPDGRPRVLVNIDGPITRNDLDSLRRGIDLRRKPYILVFLASRGGDWNAAMAIGRFLRGASAGTNVSKSGCYSSCVLLLASGIHRQIAGPVGIHRPFSTDTSPQTFQEAQLKYRVLEAAAKSYLSEMNLPDALFDAMVRVPPESIRVLTVGELDAFGLSQDDPVAQEIDDAEEARKFGLSKQEYLRRKARREKICEPQDLGPDRLNESIESLMSCRKAVMQGLR